MSKRGGAKGPRRRRTRWRSGYPGGHGLGNLRCRNAIRRPHGSQIRRSGLAPRPEDARDPTLNKSILEKPRALQVCVSWTGPRIRLALAERTFGFLTVYIIVYKPGEPHPQRSPHRNSSAGGRGTPLESVWERGWTRRPLGDLQEDPQTHLRP